MRATGSRTERWFILWLALASLGYYAFPLAHSLAAQDVVEAVDGTDEPTLIVAPLTTVTLSCAQDGRISRLPLQLGSVVQEGEWVIEQDDTEWRLSLEKIRAELAAAELAAINEGTAASLKSQIDAKTERLRLLHAIAVDDATKRISPSTPQERFEIQKDIERLEGELSAEKSVLFQAARQAEAKRWEEKLALWQLERAKVKAPFAGVVRAIERNEGDMVKQGDPVAELIRLDRLQINILYFTADANPGDVIGRVIPIRTLRAADGQEWTGEAMITRVVPGINQSNTFRAFAEFDNQTFVNSSGVTQWRLWPGMELVIAKSSAAEN